MLHRTVALFFFLVCVSFAHAQSNPGAMSDASELALKLQASPPAALPPTPPANAVGYSGSNAAGPQWNRPFADGTCCSGLGPVRYTTQLFNISSNDVCDISSVQDGFDGYLFIYTSPFNAGSQTVNFVAGDDDGNGGIGTSDLQGLALTAGTTYVAVTTGFANGDEGAFTNTINCPTATVSLGAVVAFAQPAVIPAGNGFSFGLLIAAFALAALLALRAHRN